MTIFKAENPPLKIKDLTRLCIFNDIQLHGFLSAYDFIKKGIVLIVHWLELINISGIIGYAS